MIVSHDIVLLYSPAVGLIRRIANNLRATRIFVPINEVFGQMRSKFTIFFPLGHDVHPGNASYSALIFIQHIEVG